MMNALEKLVARCNEMDMTEQDQWLGDVFMPQQAQKDLARLQAIEAAARDVVSLYELGETVDKRIGKLAAALDRKPSA
jgi:hypothetical protein